MKILIRDKAYEDLERICAWIAKDDVRAARRAIDEIFQTMERLGKLPDLGREGAVRNTREWIVRGLPYIIVYRTMSDALVIEAVFRFSQNH